MKLPLYTINAFADAPFTGNPAAVCPLESWLDDSLLQNIAAQNNLAETVYFVKTGESRYHIRWFTPTTEVPLCGHATLASAFALRSFLGETASRLIFDSLSGPLYVDCHDSQFTLDFPSKAPSPHALPDWFVNVFGANPVEFLRSNYFLAIFGSQEIVAAIEPDFGLLAKVPDAKVVVSAPGKDHDFVSRFFAPAVGVDEDPVTGSAHCTLTPYWAKRLKKQTLSARQISKRGGNLTCRLSGDRVELTGSAQLYSEATIHV